METEEATLREYVARINGHAFDAVEPLLADDAVFWFSDGTHRGKLEIRAAFEKTWRLIREEECRLEGVTWIARGDRAASCVYEFHWSGLVDGRALSGKVRGTTVLRREGAAWKIVHEHLSRYPTE